MPRKRAWSKLPVREVSARMLPSQQSASYDDDETQNMQDELYRPTLPQDQVHDDGELANDQHLQTNMERLIDPQFNPFDGDNDNRPHSTHGWDHECNATQDPIEQDQGIDETQESDDPILARNEVQTIGMYIFRIYLCYKFF
jgi:hypothetical protein